MFVLRSGRRGASEYDGPIPILSPCNATVPAETATFDRPGQYLLARCAAGPQSPQHLPNQGLSQGVLSRRARSRLERLALAGAEPAANPGPTGTGVGAFGARADGPHRGRGDAPGEHNALLHEPDLARRPRSASAADYDSHRRRAPSRPRRGRRSAGRRRRQPRAGLGPPLSRPRAAAGDRLLLELLPLLHALADGRPRVGRSRRGPPGAGLRLYPPHAGGPRRAHFRRRPACR